MSFAMVGIASYVHHLTLEPITGCHRTMAGMSALSSTCDGQLSSSNEISKCVAAAVPPLSATDTLIKSPWANVKL